ncbi:MAG TPA: 4Fe-4S binding protein [Candidatus Brocadiia bacterium]|nr:4Fe-4S binding protein [Candidatus Brocadiia bacterium]
MIKVRILERYCKGCGLCVSFCRQGVLAIGEQRNKLGYEIAEAVAPDKCVGCSQCALMCPDAAIEIVKETDAGAEAEK